MSEQAEGAEQRVRIVSGREWRERAEAAERERDGFAVLVEEYRDVLFKVQEILPWGPLLVQIDEMLTGDHSPLADRAREIGAAAEAMITVLSRAEYVLKRDKIAAGLAVTSYRAATGRGDAAPG